MVSRGVPDEDEGVPATGNRPSDHPGKKDVTNEEKKGLTIPS